MIEPFKLDMTAQCLYNSFSNEETDRRNTALRNKDFYYDRQEQYVNTFNIEAIPVIIPLTRPIVKKRCSMLYRNKLIRELEGPAESVSFIEDLYTENDIDSIFLQADLLSELTGTVLLSLAPDESYYTGYRVTLWDGSAFSAVPKMDNPNSIDALSLLRKVDKLSKASTKTQIDVETILLQQIWTNEYVSTYTGLIQQDAQENPYGFIPFSVVKGEEVINQFCGFAPVGSVVAMNKSINQMVSDLAYTIKLQAANPIALMGFQGGESLIIQPGRAINLPLGADAKVLEMKPQIDKVLDTIKFIEQKIYETSSVPEVSIVGSEGTSGRELLIRWYPLVQVFEEKAIRFQKYELEAANNFLAMAGLEPLDSLTVKFDRDSLLPLTPEDDSIPEDISLNIITPVDIIRKRNPELTEEDALDKIINNRELNDSLKRTETIDTVEPMQPNEEIIDGQ